jgi:phosphoribosyl-ATP pyrophosphohydrolase
MSHGPDLGHGGGPEQKRIGIFVSVLAVLMAITSFLASKSANEMLVGQVEASNGFSWYQAKRQRSYANELELKRIEVQLAGTVSAEQRGILEGWRDRLVAKNAEYEKENQGIQEEAKRTKSAAEHSAHRHHRLEYAEICFHVAVVLCSLTLLTQKSLYFRVGAVLTLGGVVIVTWAMLGH